MDKIESAQLHGIWRSYKREFNNQEKFDDGGNWIEWRFEKDGKAHFLLSMDNKTIIDRIDRYWSLDDHQEGDEVIQQLTITSASEKNEIISVDKDFLVLKNERGSITHFASMLKWYSVIKN